MRRLCLVILVLLMLPLPAAWSAGEDGLRVGIFPRRPAVDSQRMFQPLADHLARELGQPVTLETPADYLAFWSAVEDDRYDLVHYNQYHYVKARHELGHRIIAKNEEFGLTQLRATLQVKRDSPYQRLSDLKGRNILFGGGRSAMISYILATDLLRNAGLNDGDYIERFAQNPVKALIALHFDQGDAAAVGELVASMPLVTSQIGRHAVRTLGYSAPVPHLPWALSRQVDEAHGEAIRDALLDLNRSHGGRGILDGMALTGIRAAQDSEYDMVRQVIQRVLGESY